MELLIFFNNNEELFLGAGSGFNGIGNMVPGQAYQFRLKNYNPGGETPNPNGEHLHSSIQTINSFPFGQFGKDFRPLIDGGPR